VGELGEPVSITVDPNGKTAYAHGLASKITPINLTTNKPGKPIQVGFSTVGPIAFTPDGKTAYVVNPVHKHPSTVIPINTSTGTTGKPIRVGPGAEQIAFTPDGKTAYVAGMGTVTPVSTTTDRPGPPISIRCCAVSIGITPDGRTLYVGTAGGPTCAVVPINTATGTAGKPIRLGSRPPEEMAIAPDGKTVYIANPEGPPGAVVPISTATNTAGKPIPVGGVVTIGLPPGGQTLYAAALAGNSLLGGRAKVVPISVATHTPGTPIRIPIRVGLPLGVITP
jgi:DNA-binding beta-propeller fold protein YncE